MFSYFWNKMDNNYHNLMHKDMRLQKCQLWPVNKNKFGYNFGFNKMWLTYLSVGTSFIQLCHRLTWSNFGFSLQLAAPWHAVVRIGADLQKTNFNFATLNKNISIYEPLRYHDAPKTSKRSM